MAGTMIRGWKARNSNRRPIGLDIGHNSIKMIQLAINGGRMSVVAGAKVRIDPSVNGEEGQRRDFVVSAIKRVLGEGNFQGRNVVSCLSNERLKVTSVRVGEADDEELEQVLRKEAMQRFGLDGETDPIRYLVAGDVKQGDETKNELILFATDSDAIREHIEMLEEVKLRPVGIDTVPCALFRSFQRSLRRQEDKDRTVVFVDVGSRYTTVVFGRSEEVNFVKQIPIGGENFSRQIASKLGISSGEAEMLRRKLRTESSGDSESGAAERGDDLDVSTRQVLVDAITGVSEDLAREMSLCLRYYTVTFRGKRVERAVLSGGEAYERILVNVLRRQLAVEIEVAQPLRGFDMTDVNFESDRRGLLCEWAVAVGLSLKGWNWSDNQTDNSYERNRLSSKMVHERQTA